MDTISYKPSEHFHQKVVRLLDQLNFKPEHIFCTEIGDMGFRFHDKTGVEAGHHYYIALSVADQITGKKDVIKIQLDSANQPDHVFIRHRSFAKEQKFYHDNAGKLSFMPKYVASGRFGDLNWLTYEFIPGETLGLAHTVVAQIEQPRIEQLIKTLGELSLANASEQTHLPIKDGAYFNEYIEKFLEAHAYTIDRLLTPEQKQTLISLTANLGRIIDQEQPYLVHGDFHPGNIILRTDDALVSVIDWELVHLGTPVLDVAKIWNRAWRTSWRHELITAARKHLLVKNFDDQFRILALHYLIDGLVFWYSQSLSKEDVPLKETANLALAVHFAGFKSLIDGEPLEKLAHISW